MNETLNDHPTEMDKRGRKSLWLGLIAGMVIAGALLAILYPLLVPPNPAGQFGEKTSNSSQAKGVDRPRPLGPVAFPVPAPKRRDETFADWWVSPRPLSDEEVGFWRFFNDIGADLPADKWDETWNFELRKGANGIRFFAAFAGYGAALYTMRLPAYVGRNGRMLKAYIDTLLRKPSWDYAAKLWKDKPWAPDPVPFENIMFTGHLIQMMAHYEAATGDKRYHTEGFDLVWDEKMKFHYTLDQVLDITVGQMDKNPSGGVPCEPGNIFFSCNNHPHVGMKLLTRLGYRDYDQQHDKWEKFALAGYYHKAPGGVVRFAYNQDTDRFFPAAAVGFDAWSSLWYLPWASDPEVSHALWKLIAAEIKPQAFRERPKIATGGKAPLLGIATNLYNMAIGLIPPMSSAAFLYAAAAAHEDRRSALLLKKILEQASTVDERGVRHFQTGDNYNMFTVAAMGTGVVLEGGANVRALVQRPLPRDYFDGPLLEDVSPQSAAVYQAYRDRNGALVVEVESLEPVSLTLRNVSAIDEVQPLSKDQWTYHGSRLSVNGTGRQVYRIVPR